MRLLYPLFGLVAIGAALYALGSIVIGHQSESESSQAIMLCCLVVWVVQAIIWHETRYR